VGVVVLLGVAGAGGYLYLAADDDATAAGDAAASEAPQDSQAATTSAAGGDTDATTATTVAGSQTTEAATTDTAATDDTTTTAAAAPTQVADFRAILVQNELTSDQLSDEQINNFGSQFCSVAMASTDRASFEAFRQQAIDEAVSDLTPEELTLVTDAAVVAFCPEEAERLGISL
jgi:hypothetical protein